MFNNDNKNMLHYLILALIVFFIFEFVFMQTSSLIWLIIWAAITYFAWQYYYRPEAKTLFWIGIVILAIIVMNTTLFRFILFAGLALLFFHWYQSKPFVTKHQPQFSSDSEMNQQKILFTNKWFGKQETERKPYEWRDINIQSIIGETIIDLNQTVLPKGEPIIIVRHLIGNVQIIVPFDVEVSVHHSVLMGSINLMGHRDEQITNRVIHFETADYQTANQKVRIYTSMTVGKIEVKRG